MKIQPRAWKQFISSNSRLLSFPHRIRYAVQIILSVLLAAVIVSHSRQSRSLRGFFLAGVIPKTSTVTYINLTE